MTRRALAEKRNQLRNLQITRWGKSLLLTMATVATFTVVALLVLDQLYRPESFQVKEVHVKGQLKHVDPQLVVEKLNTHLHNNFFTLDLNIAKEILQDMDWISQVSLRRSWPSILIVEIEEHQPLVRWNESSWLTKQGEVIELDFEGGSDPQLRLYGNDSDAPWVLSMAKYFDKALSEQGLRLRKVELSGSHAWSLTIFDPTTDSLFPVLLGQNQFDERFARFVTWYKLQPSASDSRLIDRVDARYPDGLAVIERAVVPQQDSSKEEMAQRVAADPANPSVAM
jgi:cell division protein FtsQ